MTRAEKTQTPEHLVRMLDPGRFFATQFAPPDARNDLYALYAFDLEIRKIPQIITEPMAGEIRLQWWQDVLARKRDEEASAHPVAAEILRLSNKYAVDLEIFERYFDGRIFDLYADVLEDRAAFEAYAGQTDGTILQLASLILQRDTALSTAETAGYLSCVNSIMSRVLKPILNGATNRAIRYLPPEFQSKSEVETHNPYISFSKQDQIEIVACVFLELEQYLQKARASASNVHDANKPAFLAFATVEPILNKMRKKIKQDALRPIELSSLRVIYRLWRASKRWPCF